MANGEIGANIDQLGTLRAAFEREAQTTEALVRAIRSQLASTHWVGGAAERFRTVWQDEFEPSLRNLENALVEASREVENRRQRLIDAGGSGA